MKLNKHIPLVQTSSKNDERTMVPKDPNLAFLAGSATRLQFSDVQEILLNYECAGTGCPILHDTIKKFNNFAHLR